MVLGGAFNVNGNVNPAAEANIYGDPDAANVVFSRCYSVVCCGISSAAAGGQQAAAGRQRQQQQQRLLRWSSLVAPTLCSCHPSPFRVPNCWLVGLDVTHECRMSAAAIEGLAGRGRHGTFLRAITQFYLAYHR